MTENRVIINRLQMKFQNSQKGNAIVIVIVFFFALLGIAGLVLDYSRGVWARTMLQKAADSAALAGASYLPDQGQAEMQAAIMLGQNYPTYDTANYASIDYAGESRFSVKATDSVDVYFMRVFGHKTMPVAVTATAVTMVNAGGLRGGAFPFCIINPNTNNDPSDDLKPSNVGEKYIIGYGENNVNVPDWANGKPPTMTPSDLGPARGWRSALGLMMDGTMSNDAGADDIIDAMLNGWSGDLRIGDVAKTKTGNMTAIARARDQLIANSELTSIDDFNPRLHANDSRVVLVPIVHLINDVRRDEYTWQDFNNDAAWDHGEVVIDGFAPFYLLSAEEQGDINGNGKLNDDRDFITGIYLPPIGINNYLPPVEGAPEWGVYSTARLID